VVGQRFDEAFGSKIENATIQHYGGRMDSENLEFLMNGLYVSMEAYHVDEDWSNVHYGGKKTLVAGTIVDMKTAIVDYYSHRTRVPILQSDWIRVPHGHMNVDPAIKLVEELAQTSSSSRLMDISWEERPLPVEWTLRDVVSGCAIL